MSQRIYDYAEQLADEMSDYLTTHNEKPGMGLCGVDQFKELLYEIAKDLGYDDLNVNTDETVVSHFWMYTDYVRKEAIPDGSWSEHHLTELGKSVMNGKIETEEEKEKKRKSSVFIAGDGSTPTANEYLIKIFDKELKPFFTNEYDFFDTEVSGKAKFFSDVKSDLSSFGGVNQKIANTINLDKECTNEAKEYIDAVVEVVKDAMIYPYHGEWTSYLNERGLLQRSFISACRNGNFSEVRDTVLNSGTDMVAEVTALDNAAIVLSSTSGHLEITKFLISNGADIHAQDDKALKKATLNKHIRIVEELFDNSSDQKKSLKIITRINHDYGDFIKKKIELTKVTSSLNSVEEEVEKVKTKGRKL